MSLLAINGGPKAVTVHPAENWKAPVEAVKQQVCKLIYDGIWFQCGPGDEVLHPAYTWICSIAPAVHMGARPVFCEVDPETLLIDPSDLEKRIQYRAKIFEALGNIKGITPVKSYPKAKPAGFYGGMHMLYQPEELDGLPVEKLLETLKAEGVDMSHRGYGLTHRLKLFADGFDIYGKGNGPLTGDYPGYPEGSLPVTEEVHNRILGMPTYIEETPGDSDAVVQAMEKVTENYKELL